MRNALRAHAFVVALVLAVGASATALAEGFRAPSRGIEIRGGLLAHDVPELWSGSRLEKGVDINAEVLLGPGMPFLFGMLRPAIGGSVNTRGYTSKAYIDARWELETPSGVFFGMGLGAALHDGNLGPTEIDRKALGSRVLFHIPFEVGLRFNDRHSISIYFEHASNAYTRSSNEGLDDIGIRYGYRF